MQPRIDPVARGVQLGIEDHVAAVDEIFGDIVAGEIEGTPLAGPSALRRAILRMDRANARG